MSTAVKVSIPPINLPRVDPQTGLATDAWYRFDETMFKRTGGIGGDRTAVVEVRLTAVEDNFTALDSTVTALSITVAGNTASIAANTTAIAANTASLLLKANIASPTFTGVPSAPTATAGTNTTQIATTAFVTAAVSAIPGSPVTSVAGRTGAVVLTKSDVGLSNVDNTADTAKPVSTAQQTAIDAKVENSITSGHTTVAPSGDAVFSALALKSPLASPTFTGTPVAPTNGTATDATTQIATDAFVQAAIAAALADFLIFRVTEASDQRVTEAGSARIEEI